MDIVLILQNIRSLHNVGSVFRTADAFGVSKLHLCGYTGAPPRKEISKVALGAETWIPWEKHVRAESVITRLKKDGYQIVALETGKGSVPIARARFRAKVALILGNEVTGITPAILRRSDVITSIPMLGKKGSLNVSVAAGIALFSVRASGKGKKKRKIRGSSVRRRGSRPSLRTR